LEIGDEVEDDVDVVDGDDDEDVVVVVVVVAIMIEKKNDCTKCKIREELGNVMLDVRCWYRVGVRKRPEVFPIYSNIEFFVL